MPYAIVETLEEGLKMCFLVPECWIQANVLWWPIPYKHDLAKEQKKPGDDWQNILIFTILKCGIGIDHRYYTECIHVYNKLIQYS